MLCDSLQPNYSFVTELSRDAIFKANVEIDEENEDEAEAIDWEGRDEEKIKDVEDDPDYDFYYHPMFVLALRDFKLELKKDGKKVTPDKYLEHLLELKKEVSDHDKVIIRLYGKNNFDQFMHIPCSHPHSMAG